MPPDDARNVYIRRLADARRTSEVLDVAAAALGPLLPGDRGFVLQRDAGGGWQGVHGIGERQDVAESLRLPDPQVVDAAIASGEVTEVKATIADHEGELLVVPAGGPGTGAAIAFEIGAAGGAQRRSQDPEELAALVGQTWLALSRAQTVSELQGKVEILEAIAGVAALDVHDLPSLLEGLLCTAAKSLSAERVGVYLTDDDGALRLAAFRDATRRQLQPDREDPRASGVVAVDRISALGPRAVLIEQDVAAATWPDGPWGVEAGAVSTMAVPLELPDQTVGWLLAAHTEAAPRGFTSSCQQVGEALGRQSSVALGVARLLAAKAAAVAEVARRDEHRADYVNGITHDLRSPVTAILGFAQTLRRVADRLSAEDQMAAVQAIERQALRTSRMLTDMVDAARIDGGVMLEGGSEVVAIADIIDEALLVITPEHLARTVVTADPNAATRGDPDRLIRVVSNLHSNALHHAPPGTEVHITASLDDADVVLEVSDEGPGLPAGIDVFARYASTRQGGTGLGLHIVRRIVMAHGGTITARANSQVSGGSGTRMIVRLPAAPAAGNSPSLSSRPGSS